MIRESKLTYMVKFWNDSYVRECVMDGDEWVHVLDSGFRVHKNDIKIESVTTAELFQVVEYMSFFAVRHVPTGKEHPMGDGVDSVFDSEENAMSPGTDKFVEAWASSLNADRGSVMEAYFSDISDLEEKTCDECGGELKNFMKDDGTCLGEVFGCPDCDS